MSESHGCGPPNVDQRVEFEKLIQILYLSLSPDSSVSSGPQFEDCVAKLSHLRLSELSSTPNRIQLEEENIRRKTEQLAVENYPIFLANAQTSRDVHREFMSISESNVNLLSSIAEVSGAAQNIVDNVGKNASSFRTYANSIQRCTHILEFLELPQLMETSIQNGYYQDALNILNHIKHMVKKYCRLVPIVRVIGLQAQEIGWHLFNQLCKQLREPITLPVCLKVVIYLRQLDAFNELELRLNFLQARGICIRDQLEMALSRPIGMSNFESSTTKLTDVAGCRQLECKAFIRAMRRIEVTRVQLFDSITQYRAVFVDDDAYSTKLTDQQTLLADLSPIYFNETPRTLRHLLTSGVDDFGPCNGTSLFHAWLVRQIGDFLDGLNADLDSLLFLPHLTPSEISDRIQMTMANDSIGFGTVDVSTTFQQIHSIMAQALYFGRSFARIGCDFRAHLGPIFSRAILSYVNALLVNALLELNVILELWPWELSETSFTSEQLEETNPHDIPAPIAVAHHPPLAFFCNRLLTLFNGLRICCPVSLRDRVLSACIRTLSEAAVAITTAYKFQQLDSTTGQGQGFRLASVFVHTAIPHLLTCLLDHVFGGDALAHLWQLRPEVEEILTTSRIVSQLTRQVCAPMFAVWEHLSVGPLLTNDESARIQHEHISLPLAVGNRQLSEVQNAEAKPLSATSLIASETPFSVEQDLSATTVLETEPPSISPVPKNDQEMLISTVTLTSSVGEDDTQTLVEPARSTQMEETSVMSSQEPLDFNSSNTLVNSQLNANASSFPVEIDSSLLESDRGSFPFSGNKMFIGSEYPFMTTAPEFSHESAEELQGEATSITLSVDKSNVTVQKELGEEAVASNAEKPELEEVSLEPVESSLEKPVSLTLSDAHVQKSSASELALSLDVSSPVNLLSENEKEDLVCDKISISDSGQRELERTTCSPLEIPVLNHSNAERPSGQINLDFSAPVQVLPMDDSSINQRNLENQGIALGETKSHRFEDVVPANPYQYLSTIKEQADIVYKEENVDSIHISRDLVVESSDASLAEPKSASFGDTLFNVNFPDIHCSPPSNCFVAHECKLEPMMLKPEEVNAFGVTQVFVPTPSESRSLDSRLNGNIYDASLIAPSTVVFPPPTMECQLDIDETVAKHNETDFCGRVEESVDEKLAVHSAPSRKECYLTSGEKSLDNPANDETQLISDDSVTTESEGGKICDTRSIPVPVLKRGNSGRQSLSEGSETVNEFADWSSDANARRSLEDADDHTVGAHDVPVIACQDALDVQSDQEPQSLMGAQAVFPHQDVPTQPAEGYLTDGGKSDAPSSFSADDTTVMKMTPTDLTSKVESPSAGGKQTYHFINAENRRPRSQSFSIRDIRAKTESPADKDIAFFATADTELGEVERGNEENLQEGRISESQNEESNKLLETDKSADINIADVEEKGDLCTVHSTDQRSLVMPQSESVERSVEEHQCVLQSSGTDAKMPPLGDENLAKDETESATQSAEVIATYGEEGKYEGDEDQISSHLFTSSEGPKTQMQETETDELHCEAEEEDFTGGDTVSDQNPQARPTPDSEELLKSKLFNDERSDNGRVDFDDGSMPGQALEPPTSQKGNRPTSRESSSSGQQGEGEALAVSHSEPDVSSDNEVPNVPGQNVVEAGSMKFKGSCEADENPPDSSKLSAGELDTERVDKIDAMANKEKEESSEILIGSENEPHFDVSGLDQSKTTDQQSPNVFSFAEPGIQEPISQSAYDKTKITDINEAGKCENVSEGNVFESQSVGVGMQQSEMEELPSFGPGRVELTFAGGVSSKAEESLKVASLWDDNTAAWSESPGPEANSSIRVETSSIEILDKGHKSVDPNSMSFGREAGLPSLQSSAKRTSDTVNALRCSLSDCATRDATNFHVHDSAFHEADTTEHVRNESPSSNADWEEDCENAWGRDADIDVGDEEIREILCDKEFNESTTSASESKMIRQSDSVGFHSDLRDSTGNENDGWRINSHLAISQSLILDKDPRIPTDLTGTKHWDPTELEGVACERAVSDEAKLSGESIDDRCHRNSPLLSESELHGSNKLPILGVTADDSTYVGGDTNNSREPMSDDPDRNIGVDEEEKEEEEEMDNSTGDTSTPLELFAVQPNAEDEAHMTDRAELGVATSADKAKESDRQEDAPRTETFNLGIVGGENNYEESEGVLGAQISAASGKLANEVEQGEADAPYRGAQETLNDDASAEEDSTEKHSTLSEELPKTSDWCDGDHKIPLQLTRGDHGSEYIGSGFCLADGGGCIAEEPKSVEALVPPSSGPSLSQPDSASPPRTDADRQKDTLPDEPAGDFTASNVLNPESVAMEPSNNPFLTAIRSTADDASLKEFPSAFGKDAAGDDEIAEGWDVDF